MSFLSFSFWLPAETQQNTHVPAEKSPINTKTHTKSWKHTRSSDVQLQVSEFRHVSRLLFSRNGNGFDWRNRRVCSIHIEVTPKSTCVCYIRINFYKLEEWRDESEQPCCQTLTPSPPHSPLRVSFLQMWVSFLQLLVLDCHLKRCVVV